MIARECFTCDYPPPDDVEEVHIIKYATLRQPTLPGWTWLRTNWNSMATIIISGSRPSHGLTGSTRRHDLYAKEQLGNRRGLTRFVLSTSIPPLPRPPLQQGREREELEKKLVERNSLGDTPRNVRFPRANLGHEPN